VGSEASEGDPAARLHWLPIEWPIKFKLASLTYKALHTGHPQMLGEVGT